MFVFLTGVVILWLPLALPLYWLSAQGLLPGGDLFPTVLLYFCFLGLFPRWARWVHKTKHPWYQIGLTGTTSVFKPLLKGLGIGVVSIVVLVALQIMPGWAKLSPPEQNWIALILAGSLTAMAVGWAEELLFRGWLMYELEQGGSARAALVGTGFIFALAHFIKPWDVILDTWPQFLGLVMLGLVLGWARRCPILQQEGTCVTSIGFPLGLHSGLVWGYYVLSVGDLLQPTLAVPIWVTGLEGNPLAGVLGILLLCALAVMFRHWATPWSAGYPPRHSR